MAMVKQRDLKDTELRLDSHLREVELRLKQELKDLELKLVMRMGAMTAATIAIPAALITFK